RRAVHKPHGTPAWAANDPEMWAAPSALGLNRRGLGGRGGRPVRTPRDLLLPRIAIDKHPRMSHPRPTTQLTGNRPEMVRYGSRLFGEVALDGVVNQLRGVGSVRAPPRGGLLRGRIRGIGPVDVR